jgi:hypothetical protein
LHAGKLGFPAIVADLRGRVAGSRVAGGDERGELALDAVERSRNPSLCEILGTNPMGERDQLAGFHRVISEQLNARLAESPRFFWTLVAATAGYGYVLWNQKSDAPAQHIVVTLAAVLSYGAILWASYYLAALGYAFRFLQNCQHCIEHALGWDAYTPTGPLDQGAPRHRAGGVPSGRFGHALKLLPGIYHAHVFGLVFFLGLVVAAGCWDQWLKRPSACLVIVGVAAFVLGTGFIVGINWYYALKLRRIWRDPDQAPVVSP